MWKVEKRPLVDEDGKRGLVRDCGVNKSTTAEHAPLLSPGCTRGGRVGSPHQGSKITQRRDLESVFCLAGTLLTYRSEEQKGVLDAWLFGELGEIPCSQKQK